MQRKASAIARVNICYQTKFDLPGRFRFHFRLPLFPSCLPLLIRILTSHPRTCWWMRHGVIRLHVSGWYELTISRKLAMWAQSTESTLASDASKSHATPLSRLFLFTI